ncbi:COG4695 Phage-related protein [uncultured Caudovirales phage]|uniref:COG4695 Phage-related protein n=1 Tax=uncultured Caudovirales phage TaxID=2100421 RepID=A0A6J5N1M7_9CAUD|nr:COG4695 Phage-related protein [uncultured Caudovirales phage]
MSILSRALGIRKEERLFNLSARIPLPGAQNLTDAGVPVTDETAQALTAVWSSARLIADTIASLPVGSYYRAGGVRLPAPRPAWLDRPDLSDPNSTGYQFWQSLVTSLLYAGNAYVLYVRDAAGEVVETHVLNPYKVRPERVRVDGQARILYRIRGEHDDAVLDSDQIIHIPLFRRPGDLVGVSPIEACRLSIGSALAAEAYGARWFRNSGVPSGVIEVPSELTGDQAGELLDAWRRTHSGLNGANLPGILTGGARFTPISFKPEDVSWLEARRFGVEEVARIFRVPPFMLGVNTPGAVSYASTEQAMIYFVQHTIRPFLEQIETSFSRIIPDAENGTPTFLRFQVDGLLRGDVKTRYEAYATGIQNGFLRISDVRALEDLTPLEASARQYLRPLNLAPASLADAKTKADIYATLVGAGVDPAEAQRLSEAAG